MTLLAARGNMQTPLRIETPMYLSGSKWNTRKKRRRIHPLRVGLLVLLVAAAVYV